MSVATDVMDAGGIGTFNLEHGFPEAVVRGFRSGLLTDYDYHHLTQVHWGSRLIEEDVGGSSGPKQAPCRMSESTGELRQRRRVSGLGTGHALVPWQRG